MHTKNTDSYLSFSCKMHLLAVILRQMEPYFNLWQCYFGTLIFMKVKGGKNSVVDEVKHYLDINYAEKLKLKDIAKSFGIHPNYLTQSFHEKYGISPKQYVLSLKLKKALKLLTTTELSVSVIASSLGFNDSLAFSKIF